MIYLPDTLMYRSNIKYRNGIIYKIFSKKNPFKVYIGSTYLTKEERFKYHKTGKTNSTLLFKEFGYENCEIEIVIPFPCDNKYQLEQHEMIWIIYYSNLENYKCVNKYNNKPLWLGQYVRPYTRKMFLKERMINIKRELQREIERRYNVKTQDLRFDYFVDRGGKVNVMLVMCGDLNLQQSAINQFYINKKMGRSNNLITLRP
jgi:hypothetical protein